MASLLAQLGVAIDGNRLSAAIVDAKKMQVRAVGEREHQVRDTASLAEAIGGLLQQAKPNPIESHKAIISLAESLVFSKVITLPKMDQRQTARAIPHHMADFLAQPIYNYYTDFTINPLNKTENQVLVVTVAKSIVDSLLTACKGNKIMILAIESAGFSLWRSIRPQLNPTRASFILEIADHAASWAIVNQDLIFMTGFYSVGATDYIQNQQLTLEKLKVEITATIDYYQNRFDHRNYQYQTDELDHLYLMGQLEGELSLMKSLEKALNLTVKIGYSSIKLPGGLPILSRFNGAIGASLR